MQVEHPTGEVVTLVYDPDGHRVAQDDGVATQQFVYDGNNLLQERDDMGTVEADYTYVPQEYARYVSQQRDAESRFYHASGIRDVTQLTDAGETVTDDYRFDAWGKPLATTGSTENPHTYKGEAGYQSAPQLSAEESTYYLHHRVLPSQGRFLSEDPLDDDANAYRYVRNNPVNAVDPSGLEAIRIPTASGDVVIPDSAQTGYIGRLASQLREAEAQGNTRFAATVRRTLLVTWNEQQGLHSEHQLYSAQQKRLHHIAESIEPIYGPIRETKVRVGKTAAEAAEWAGDMVGDAAEWVGDRYVDTRTFFLTVGYETRSPEAYRRFQEYLEYNAIQHGPDVARELSGRPWDPEYITPNEEYTFDVAAGGTLEVLTGGLTTTGPFASELINLADDVALAGRRAGTQFVRSADDVIVPSGSAATTTVEAISQVNPRLVRRLEAFRAYKANGGAMDMRRWVQATQGNSAYGTGFKSGFADWSRQVGKPIHGNSLLAPGPHDVYVLRNAVTGEVLHFGETGRGYITRLAEHQRDYAKLGIRVRSDFLDTVEGKAAARALESRYIDTYIRVFGQRPPFNSGKY